MLFKVAYSCCFGLRGNLDFPDFLQKSFITLTTGMGTCDPIWRNFNSWAKKWAFFCIWRIFWPTSFNFLNGIGQIFIVVPKWPKLNKSSGSHWKGGVFFKVDYFWFFFAWSTATTTTATTHKFNLCTENSPQVFPSNVSRFFPSSLKRDFAATFCLG